MIQISWLKDCEICNTGLCSTVNNLKEKGLTEHAACKQLSEESEGLYSTEAIRGRYQWHTGKVKKKVKKKVVENQQPKEYSKSDIKLMALRG